MARRVPPERNLRNKILCGKCLRSASFSSRAKLRFRQTKKSLRNIPLLTAKFFTNFFQPQTKNNAENFFQRPVPERGRLARMSARARRKALRLNSMLISDSTLFSASPRLRASRPRSGTIS
jgi:hypothetical protein